MNLPHAVARYATASAEAPRPGPRCGGTAGVGDPAGFTPAGGGGRETPAMSDDDDQIPGLPRREGPVERGDEPVGVEDDLGGEDGIEGGGDENVGLDADLGPQDLEDTDLLDETG